NEAIEKAAKSIDPTNDNKMFSHQRRVGKIKAADGYGILLLKKTELEECKKFEEIIAITDKVMKEVERLGPLWSYDTALRIGFHFRVYPTGVYIQAGVKKGYKKIFNENSKNRFEDKDKFPQELQVLEPYEIENFLCIWGNDKVIKKLC
ncbi:hypothetical protein, partial [Flavobacterium sp.]|uniref:hypothetical protein n=1 Tax=Flavobacterium sp. TaxID=239 RepID=UPI000ED5E2C6